MNTNGNTTSLELDAMTARLLVHVAEAWGVSEEEAVRLALEQARAKIPSSDKEARWEAFKELQQSLDLTPAKAAEWQNAIHKARR